MITTSPANAMNKPLKIAITKAGDPNGEGIWIEVPCVRITQDIAVHPEVTYDTENERTLLGERFEVTHIPSGKSMASAPYMECAVSAAKALAALPVRWGDVTSESAKSLSPEMMNQIKFIRAAALEGANA